MPHRSIRQPLLPAMPSASGDVRPALGVVTRSAPSIVFLEPWIVPLYDQVNSYGAGLLDTMPRPYSTSELESMMTDVESHLVKRKKSAKDRSAIRRSICAFANDLPNIGRPGVILLGVEDDGRCAGLPITDELLLNLASIQGDGSLQPLPSLTVEKRNLSGCTVAVVLVEPTRHPPMRFSGRVFVRVGPSTRQATPDDEQRLTERSQARHRPFDHRLAQDSSPVDLDLKYAETEYIPRAVAQDVIEQNRRPLEQQLRSLRLVQHNSATWGALLGIGKDPQEWLPGAYVQFLRIDGTEITDPILDQKKLTGRIGDLLHNLDEILKLNIAFRTNVADHSRELKQPDYPIAALQQLVRNAVMHRSYEDTHAPVRIYWYSDRIEIASPGSLYGKVSVENFGSGDTDYRNPLVAEIMHHLGFAQRFGLGVPLARRKLAENGNPAPEFDFPPAHVTVTVRPAR